VLDGFAHGRVNLLGLMRTTLAATRFRLGGLSFSALLTESAGSLRGVEEAEYRQDAQRVFGERLATAIHPEARALVRAHQAKGHTVAIVSSATPYQIQPVADELGIEHVLCSRLEVAGGRFTGHILPPTCYGVGKKDAAEAFSDEHDVDMALSYFYTDSHEDMPLLDVVGRPRPTNPDATLVGIAARRRWPTRRFTHRGTPSALEMLRSTMAIGSLVPSLALGLPVALLERSWRPMVNLAATTWGELGTALAGIHLHVTGEQHLWSHRPAVFIFNHQSGVEVLLLCKLLHRDFVGISKQEVRTNPLFGPAFAIAGTVFIDRSDRTKAIEALAPAVEALHQGLSIAIAPEGTRSTTGRLARFRKGAFHLAMQARVPLVPIVFRNSLDVLPKHGLVVRAGTVEVVVHPPIPTDDWTPRHLDARIAGIEQLYEETLRT
jgi:putative phosphoserine phosphatase/1-acylglycerol-3-phosphate O-acyltransferase